MIGAVILLILGLAFVLAEVFFPSLGLLAVIAAACFLVADVMAFDAGGQFWGWTFIAVEVVMIPLTVRMAFQWLPKFGFGRRMLLPQPEDVGAGLPDLAHLLSKEGRAETDLRPSGRASFGAERHSVIARSGVIAAGTPLVVVAIEGSEIQVRAVDETSPDESVKES